MYLYLVACLLWIKTRQDFCTPPEAICNETQITPGFRSLSLTPTASLINLGVCVLITTLAP